MLNQSFNSFKLEPRDNRIIVNCEELLSAKVHLGEKQKRTTLLRKWLNKLFHVVMSDSFGRYHTNQLELKEVKSYIAKNLLRNIKKVMEGLNSIIDPQKYEEVFKQINEISLKILKDIMVKYPQSQAKSGAQQLKKKIKRTENSRMDNYDILLNPSKLGISLQMKKNNNYSKQILKILNYVIKISHSQLQKGKVGSVTHFQAFNSFLENVLKHSDEQHFKNVFIKKMQYFYKDEIINYDELTELLNIYQNKSLYEQKKQKNQKFFQKVINLRQKLDEDQIKTLLSFYDSNAEKYFDRIIQMEQDNKINVKEMKELLYQHQGNQQKQIKKKKAFIDIIWRMFHQSKISKDEFEEMYYQKMKYQSKKDNQKIREEFQQKKEKVQSKKNKVYLMCNSKISSNVKSFTETEIEAGTFRVPDGSVLRVMVKWAQELRNKLSNAAEEILKRAEPFKNNKGMLIELTSRQKKTLFLVANDQQKKISKIYEQLKQKHYQIATKLSMRKDIVLYGDQQQGNIGIFAAKQQASIGKFLFIYINQLVASLARIPTEAAEILSKDKQYIKGLNENQLKDNYQKMKSLNLVSLKIGDLMRAKFKSDEKTIIQIYQMLQQMSEKCPRLVKIVRLKDRLDSNNNDILVNVFFKNIVQCEIQMSITSYIDPKQEHFNNFCHSIYELQRAQFGPIAQCACIMSQQDPLTKSYSFKQFVSPEIQTFNNIKDYVKKGQIKTEKKGQKSNRDTNFVIYPPYICDQCGRYNKNNHPYFYDNKIQLQGHFQCNSCYFQKNYYKKEFIPQLFKAHPLKGQDILKHFQIIEINDSIKDIQNLKQIVPSKGIFIPRRANKPILRYYQFEKFNYQYYFISVKHLQTTQKPMIVPKIDQFNFKQSIKQLNQYIFLKLSQNCKLITETINNQTIVTIYEINTKKNFELLRINGQLKLRDQMIKLVNNNQIKQTYQKQKQIIHVSQKQITQELNRIEQMKNIKMLYADQNKIKTMSFVKKMKSLEQVYLNRNFIQQIEALQGLKKIKILKINGNKITQIKGLQNLVQLSRLFIGTNQITEIKGLDNLTKLKFINFVSNKITQIKGLDQLTQLIQLNLGNNLISEIKGLDNLTNLSVLYININQITKIQGLDTLTKLNFLTLDNNKITEIKGLDCLNLLNRLYLSFNKISEIKGLQNLTKLTFLSLANNKITEIKGLNSLTLLNNLILNQNLITEINGLNNLKKLTTLYLNSNKITLINGLQNLSQLTLLTIDRNKICKIEKLDNLVKLQSLYLNFNQIKEIEGVDNLRQLKIFGLAFNKISEIKGLSNLTELQILSLSNNNKINKIKELNNLTSLSSLILNFNQISQIEGLDNLIQLKSLYLSNNKISKTKGLEKLTHLTQLFLNYNEISEIKGLDNQTQLKKLYLTSNKITQISGLANLTLLETLNLDNNKISQIKNLQNLTQLKQLYLNTNQITQIKGLSNLVELNLLSLGINRITKIEGLLNLTKLTLLSIPQNKITQIKGLEGLNKLSELFLNLNQITQLIYLNNLSLKTFNIRHNKIKKNQQNITIIKNMIQRGIKVELNIYYHFDGQQQLKNMKKQHHLCQNNHPLKLKLPSQSRCDKCLSSKVGWECTICNYSLCYQCEGYFTKMCPSGSQQLKFTEKYKFKKNHYCDVCGRRMIDNGWSCQTHGFDLCNQCHDIQ